MHKRLPVLFAGLLGGLGVVWAGAVQAADANVMTGEPSATEFIEALSPQPKTRGIRPKDETPQAGGEVNLPIVNFEFDSAQLTPSARRVLDQLAIALQSDELGGSRIRIEGHTDAVGDEGYNLSLSERRAQAVRDYLATRNVDPGRLTIVGRGENELLEPNDPDAPVNRRVRVINLGSS